MKGMSIVVSSALIGGFGPRAKCLIDTPRKKSFLNNCRCRRDGKQFTNDAITRQNVQSNFIEFIMMLLLLMRCFVFKYYVNDKL